MNPEHIIIAGAQKCGTTTLFGWLRGHPSVCSAVKRNTAGSDKELLFFGGRNWRRGFDWYSNQYVKPQLRCIDATPEYLCFPEAPERVARIFPDAKVIVTIREPVARALSQFNHYCQELPQSEKWDWRHPGATFADNVRAELDDPFPNWLGLLGRGLYAQQLRFWRRFVPEHRMLVVVMEEWMENESQAYRDILRFLELEIVAPKSLAAKHQRTYHHDEELSGVIGQLRDFYRQSNEDLFQLLGREVPAWEKFSSPGN
ncbi:MAG: sulfotransferase [Planctomycetales bacterium]|nr:sulfotransferase [Planctomycetales bacterium]